MRAALPALALVAVAGATLLVGGVQAHDYKRLRTFRNDGEKNECEKASHNCHKNAVCINSRRSYRCKCKTGFYGDGKVCHDFNECEYQNGGCVQLCVDEEGSSHCQCMPGFRPFDRYNCIDVNECLDDNGGCQQQCINTLGSFECSCKGGFALGSDRSTCEPAEKAFATAHGRCPSNRSCDHYCIETANGFACQCYPGYELVNGKECRVTCRIGNGGCHHKCKNRLGGGVDCSCAPKYILMGDRKSCVPTCELNNGGCDRQCVDTSEGPRCACPKGFVLHRDGKTCLDIDECEVRNGGCSHQCINTEGSYDCICPTGFRADPRKKECTDVDECAFNDTCDFVCTNTPGSYQCRCNEGYTLYGGSHCADTQECSINNGDCTHNCVNTEGSYYCTCRPGTRLHPNGKDCLAPDGTSSVPVIKALQLAIPSENCSVTPQVTQSIQSNITKLLQDRRISCNQCKIVSLSTSCGGLRGQRRNFRHLHRKYSSLMVVSFELDLTAQVAGAEKCDEACHQSKAEKLVKRLAKLVHADGSGKNLAAEYQPPVPFEPPSKPAKSLSAGCSGSRGGNSKKCADNISQDERGVCESGHYSFTGQKPCQPCPVGTYQSGTGRTTCRPCGAGISTYAPGATSFSDCAAEEVCSAGSYYNVMAKECMVCSVGTYQPAAGQNYCINCPGNTTTDEDGAVSVDHCKDRRCGGRFHGGRGVITSPNWPGEYPNGVNCIWQIEAEENRRILVVIPEVEMAADDSCEDVLIMRKSESPFSPLTYETCKSVQSPTAFTAKSRKLWIQFKTNSRNYAKGFSIHFVTFHAEYQELIEDIVRDGRLYSSPKHQEILKDPRMLALLLEVTADPAKYFQYEHRQQELPQSFIDIVAAKFVKFLDDITVPLTAMSSALDKD